MLLIKAATKRLIENQYFIDSSKVKISIFYFFGSLVTVKFHRKIDNNRPLFARFIFANFESFFYLF